MALNHHNHAMKAEEEKSKLNLYKDKYPLNGAVYAKSDNTSIVSWLQFCLYYLLQSVVYQQSSLLSS